METPLPYRQLQDQLRQWVKPKDQRHLQGFAEIIAAILQSKSACLGEWIPYLSHRCCGARAHMECLSYFVHNAQITAERFYEPLLRHALQALTQAPVLLTLDISVLWDKFCLVQVCLVWGGRSITLTQTVLEHGSATVGFEQYQPLLARAAQVLPKACEVTLLADRGFEHGAILQWLQQHHWAWAIRAKSDLNVTFTDGCTVAVQHLLPPGKQAYLFPNISVLNGIACHLATATVAGAKESWAVLSERAPSLQTFALYGQRFGGIEPHFKDYKSAAFGVLQSGLRNAKALTCLFMLLDCASLLALILGLIRVQAGKQTDLDWHGQRGLSFLQLGLREFARCCYQRLRLPLFQVLSKHSPPPVCASRRKRDTLDCRIEFSKVVTFSY